MAKRTNSKKKTPRKPATAAKRGTAARPAARKTAVRKPAAATRTTNSRPASARPAAARPKADAKAPPATPVATAAPRRKAGSGLTARDVQQFREMLEHKYRELRRDVGRLHDEAMSKNRRDAAGDLSSMPIHMADIGSDNYEQEFTLGLIEGEAALLREIEEALARIDAGTYGICEATGEPIGKARLKATPWTKYCYEYMLAQEKRLARRF